MSVSTYRQDTTSGQKFKFRQPVGSRCNVKRQGTKLSVEIPPAKLNSEQASSGAFAIAWDAFVVFWTASALAGGGIVLALASLPFWYAGWSLGKSSIAPLLRENLDISQQKWQLSQQLPFVKSGAPKFKRGSGKQTDGRTKDLTGASMVTSGYINNVPRTHIQLTEGVRQHVIGEGLSRTEQVWLTSAINEHLKRLGNDVSEANAAQQRWLSSQDTQLRLDERDRYNNGFGGGFFDQNDMLDSDANWWRRR